MSVTRHTRTHRHVVHKKSPANAKGATAVHVWEPSKTKSVTKGCQTTGG